MKGKKTFFRRKVGWEHTLASGGRKFNTIKNNKQYNTAGYSNWSGVAGQLGKGKLTYKAQGVDKALILNRRG